MYKKTTLAIAAAIVSLNANAKLVMNQAYVETGQQFTLQAAHNLNKQGDIYVGILRPGNTIADALPRNAQGNVTPKLANVNLNHARYIYKLTIPATLPPGGYNIFEIVTVPGGDPLNVDDWVNGFDSVDIVRGYVNNPNSVVFDTDDDGFADDDSDRDGFHDDDFDHDGHHDDDSDHDGYHDDDSDHDGYHDDDQNHDGHHDDDNHDDNHNDDSDHH